VVEDPDVGGRILPVAGIAPGVAAVSRVDVCEACDATDRVPLGSAVVNPLFEVRPVAARNRIFDLVVDVRDVLKAKRVELRRGIMSLRGAYQGKS
jgi:hypothetical protein